MEEVTKIVSKVLVHEFDEHVLGELKKICVANNLVGLKDASRDINAILSSNIDLGAIFLAETYDSNSGSPSGLELCKQINKIRPELPIFLRRDSESSLEGLDPECRSVIAGCYTLGDMDALQKLIDEYVFSMYYPVELAQGIQEVSMQALGSIIHNTSIRCDLPYLVKDQIIYGDLFSLIPLESSWCRGYMMLQAVEPSISNAIKASNTGLSSTDTSFKDTNAILNELTNMIWGGIKARYFSNSESLGEAYRTQVPIIVDHQHKYISFGSTEPQLCFKYIFSDAEGKIEDVTFYQRLIFNLSWSPDKFNESNKVIENFVESGELEFF
ncbi:MAG: chemotaxis protein CheX [Hahellaceae bacterium]|nr:chemotaxis protein CheX [Hahellaceae bacterium]MCP5168192.1 chemotaxis protein CheX [Hahellaceae bacterium]